MSKNQNPKVTASAVKLNKKGEDPKGTYLISSSGNLVRTYPIYKSDVEVQSIDTTGYAKGKQNFQLKTSKPNQAVTSENVSRKDVPTVINNLKKGATNTKDLRTTIQKKNEQSK